MSGRCGDLNSVPTRYGLQWSLSKDELGKPTDLPIPKGISGSGFFAAKLTTNKADNWSYYTSKDKVQSIVATRIEKFFQEVT